MARFSASIRPTQLTLERVSIPSKIFDVTLGAALLKAFESSVAMRARSSQISCRLVSFTMTLP
jgi:hypothetical protein